MVKCPQKHGWQAFCSRVVETLEQAVIKAIENRRPELDNASGDEPIQTWHFSLTQDCRNYLVYYMMDVIVGVARHGDQVTDMVDKPDFLELLQFLLEEEHNCFLGSQDKADYYSSLANRMLRLTRLVELQDSAEDSLEDLPDHLIPADPVDALFRYYGQEDDICEDSEDPAAESEGDSKKKEDPGKDDKGQGGEKTSPGKKQQQQQRQQEPRPVLEDTLKIVVERVRQARKANDVTALPDLSRIEMHKERYAILTRYQKRMERLSGAVKAMTQQLLQAPEDGQCQVVRLFGRDIFFVMPLDQKKVVNAFLALQEELATRYGSQDQADAEACRQHSDFVPLVKEATAMPASLLTHIDRCLKRHARKQDSENPESQTPKDQDPSEKLKQQPDSQVNGQPEPVNVEITVKPKDAKVEDKKEENLKSSVENENDVENKENQPGNCTVVANIFTVKIADCKSEDSKEKINKLGENEKDKSEDSKEKKDKSEDSKEKKDKSEDSKEKVDIKSVESKEKKEQEVKDVNGVNTVDHKSKAEQSDKSEKESPNASDKDSEGSKPTDKDSEGSKPTDKDSEGSKPTDKDSEGSKPTDKASEGAKPTEKDSEGSKPSDTFKEIRKAVKATTEYFAKIQELKDAIQDGCNIFSVNAASATSTVDYFCPAMAYLPLLPGLRCVMTASDMTKASDVEQE